MKEKLSGWDKFFRTSSLILFITTLMLIFVPGDRLHGLFFHPNVVAIHSNNFDELREYLKSNLMITNIGNTTERGLNVSVTRISESEIGISNPKAYEITETSYQYGLTETIIKSSNFLPNDTLRITFNTNVAQLDTFKRNLERIKIEYYNPVQPNVSYIKGLNRAYEFPLISIPKRE